MNPINLFGLGIQSKSSDVTAQQRINMYLEFIRDADGTNVVAYGTPGLVLFASLGTGIIRGMHAFGAYIYIVQEGYLFQVDSLGNSVNKGTLDTVAGKVSMADNGTQIMIATGASGYIYNTVTNAFGIISDGDYPGGDTVTFIDGYFIVNKPSTGQFWISGSYDGTSWDALEFATAESNPDNLIRVFADHSQLILLGDISTEFWSNTGALDFPYSRITSIEWGLAARWSVAKFDNSIIYLAKNRMGEVQVVRLQGYTPTIVSTPDIGYLINKYTTTSDASGFAYMHDEHPMYQINFPTAGESWLYDGRSDCWSKLKAYNLSRHRSEIGVTFNGKAITADYSTGLMYRLDGDTYDDNGSPLISELIGKHVMNGLELFTISELQVDLQTGSGIASGQGSNPQIMLQVSRDGGNNYGPEKWRAMGPMGKYLVRARWLRLGEGRDFVFKLKIADPVKRAILGAWMK
jgi:hypothetical protein